LTIHLLQALAAVLELALSVVLAAKVAVPVLTKLRLERFVILFKSSVCSRDFNQYSPIVMSEWKFRY